MRARTRTRAFGRNRVRRGVAGVLAAFVPTLLLVLLELPTGQAAVPAASGTAPRAGAPAGTARNTVLEGKPRPRVRPRADHRPNIVLISTDDETMTDMRWMPITRRLIGARGVTFPHMLSPHPLCCPARAQILTGQYAQNNGVRSNALALLGGFHRLDGSRTIATWLHASGYQTGFVGKYLNEFNRRDGLQPGWDVFNPTIRGVYHYYDFSMFENGHPRSYPRIYNPDLVSRRTVDYIHQFHKERRPFFIWASHVAPHGACTESQELSCTAPPVPAHRDAHRFAHERSPSLRDPAFDEVDVSDKPWVIRNNPMLSRGVVDHDFRDRIRSLQAVDRAVRATVRALRRTGELRNTIIAFTTDNGYLLGEHRYMSKNVPYEQALDVPLLVRGPGIPHGQVRRQTVAMIDLAPTFLQAAHAHADLRLDGRSLLPLVRDPRRPGYRTVLIQSGPRARSQVPYGWYYRGVRTGRYTYVHYPVTGFTELYDRRRDPAELQNVADDPAYLLVEAALQQRLVALEDCSGAPCRQDFPPLPHPLTVS
ncbi:MAG: sulfatase family protein [Nocardioidaceae bacterium]